MEWITNTRVLITGPTSGIGRQIAIDPGRRGAHVTLACRDRVRGEAVAHTIASMPAAGVDVVRVDVSSRQSVDAFVAEYTRSRPPVDVLVDNAGTIQGERRMSADGIELTFATNVLGYHRDRFNQLGRYVRRSERPEARFRPAERVRGADNAGEPPALLEREQRRTNSRRHFHTSCFRSRVRTAARSRDALGHEMTSLLVPPAAGMYALST